MADFSNTRRPTLIARIIRRLDLDDRHESLQPTLSKSNVPATHVDVIHPALRAQTTVTARRIPRPQPVAGQRPGAVPRTNDRSVQLVMPNGSIRTYYPPRPQSAGGPFHRPLNVLMAVKTHHNPSLPPAWTASHDRAICALDTQNVPISEIIRKLYRSFPELAAFIITSSMIDTRLRCLDQIPEIDYFKLGFLCTATGFVSSFGPAAAAHVDIQFDACLEDGDGNSASVSDDEQKCTAITIPINSSHGSAPVSVTHKTPLSRISETRDASIDDNEVDYLSRSPLSQVSASDMNAFPVIDEGSQLATNALSSRSRGEQAKLSPLLTPDCDTFSSDKDLLALSLNSSVTVF